MPLSEQQHEQRRGKMMASNLAAILGVSPFGTPLSAWAEITQRVPRKALDALPHIRAGNYFEPVAAQWWMDDTGRKLEANTGTHFHPRQTMIGATRDRDMVAAGSFAAGPCETKAVSVYRAEAWKDMAAPLHIEIQVCGQMFVPVREQPDSYAEIAAIVGLRLEIRRRYYDSEFADAIVGRALDFWEKFVKTDTAPPATDSDHDAETLKIMYGQSDGRVLAVDDGLRSTVVRLYECRQAIKRLKREEVGISNFIREKLTTATCWTFGGQPILTAKTNKKGQRPLLPKAKNLGVEIAESTDETEEEDSDG